MNFYKKDNILRRFILFFLLGFSLILGHILAAYDHVGPYFSRPVGTSVSSEEGSNQKNVTLIDTGVIRGYHWWLYRNSSYPCGRSGFHELLVLQKGDEKNVRNLLVYFHGGGVGLFKKDGTYNSPDNLKNMLYAERERKTLFGSALGDGLVKIFREEKNWRILVPSYCSHDFYFGKGEYSADDGFQRWGYLAAKQAIDFTEEEFPTAKVITYGTSAGASGAFYLGYQRKEVAGIVMDSNSMDLSSMKENCQKGISTCCSNYSDVCAGYKRGGDGMKVVAERIGFILGKDEPHIIIQKHEVDKPIYYIWNQNDQYYKKENAKYYFLNLHNAIQKYNPQGKSVARKVCISNPANKDLPCTVHSPSKFDTQETRRIAKWINSLLD